MQDHNAQSLANIPQKFYANPVDIPGLDEFVFDVLLASSQDRTSKRAPLVITRQPQGIERLPTELLDAICGYLPTQSAIKLHRTSKTMAMKLTLDNAFWRDSMRFGSLHPHIWGLDTKAIETLRQQSNIIFSVADWNWRSVAKLLATKQFPVTGLDPRLADMPLGLWNRCRIWSIVEKTLDFEHFEKPMRDRSCTVLEVHGNLDVPGTPPKFYLHY
jgi:hypothetical protein